MSDEVPTTISAFDERWWEGPLARRRLGHQLGDDWGDCPYPECAWRGARPGDENLVFPAAPP